MTLLKSCLFESYLCMVHRKKLFFQDIFINIGSGSQKPKALASAKYLGLQWTPEPNSSSVLAWRRQWCVVYQLRYNFRWKIIWHKELLLAGWPRFLARAQSQKLWLWLSTSGFGKSLNPTPVQFWLEEDNDVLCANYGIISDGRWYGRRSCCLLAGRDS